jgi:uncharacterized protein YcaQ
VAVHTYAPVIARLRRFAICHSLFPPASLPHAIDRLGFVQADPIRSPARAQDLILRQRVAGYRAGDLERQYPDLDVEEDYLYAYGFVSRTVWNLLHPRVAGRIGNLEKRVLDAVKASGATHPRKLEAQLGRRRVVNAWGTHSKATTQALERLHYRGLVRVARRENGIRIYDLISNHPERLEPAARLAEIVLALANILAPVLDSTLTSIIARYKHLGKPRAALTALVDSGRLLAADAGNRRYFYPAGAETDDAPPAVVRLLAPFDPVVWDRTRFEHFWGWRYRFEAYTPPARRIRGYYALPLLWRDAVIGWANASSKAGQLDVELGYVDRRPRDRVFTRELEAEIERLRNFLQKVKSKK